MFTYVTRHNSKLIYLSFAIFLINIMFFLMNVLIALKGTHFLFFIRYYTSERLLCIINKIYHLMHFVQYLDATYRHPLYNVKTPKSKQSVDISGTVAYSSNYTHVLTRFIVRDYNNCL